jgi:hypothetical protein
MSTAGSSSGCAACNASRAVIERLQMDNDRLQAAASGGAAEAEDVADLEEEVEGLVAQVAEEKRIQAELRSALVAAEARFELLAAADELDDSDNGDGHEDVSGSTARCRTSPAPPPQADRTGDIGVRSISGWLAILCRTSTSALLQRYFYRWRLAAYVLK